MGSEAPGRTTRRQALVALGGVGLGAAPAVRAAHQSQTWPAEKPTPPFNLTDLGGRAWSLTALKGEVVALNFWATWCEPCRTEMPSLQSLQARRRREGLSVLTVNYKEAPADIRRFLDTRSFDLPVLLDADGDTASAWTPRVFPTTVLIDRGGVARTTVIGALDWGSAEASALLRPLLARRPA